MAIKSKKKIEVDVEFKSRSLSHHAWKRLKRNKLALFGIGMIVCALLVVILGPLIRPDFTSQANDQILPISTHKPGFSVTMLKVRKNKIFDDNDAFTYWIYGKSNPYKMIPITNYRFEGKELYVKKYTGGDRIEEEEIPYNLADIAYAIDTDNPYIELQNGELEFYVLGEGKVKRTLQELKALIAVENLDEYTYYLGPDKQGRDLLSRLMAGTKVSLSVGIISVLISLFLGLVLGAIAGFYRGWVDDLVMWLINVVWSIPTLLLVIAMTLALGKGYAQVFLAVGLTMWVEVARIVRGQVLSLREKEFVEAGRALGFTNFRLIFKHVVPNTMGPVIVISAANFASAILIEAGLSFLGIGAQPPVPSWGSMVNDHLVYLTTEYAFLAILPGICIMLMVLAFMLIGNGLRDALDSKSVDEVTVAG
jgi:peptide/nickel transport system permease protein